MRSDEAIREFNFPTDELFQRSGHTITLDEEKAIAIDYMNKVVDLFNSFGVGAKFEAYNYSPGFVEIFARPVGTRLSKIKNMMPDISAMFGVPCTFEETSTVRPGCFGIVIPKVEKDFYTLGDYYDKYREELKLVSLLSFPSGSDDFIDLEDVPHLLVSGASGSGKSVFLNTMLAGLLMKNTPDHLGLLMIDPKKVELSAYDGIPHLLAPVATTVRDAINVLRDACDYMDSTYAKLQRYGVRNVNELRSKEHIYQQRIVVVIDELADLMMVSKGTVEDYIVRIAQLGRAAGVHLVIATQEPRTSVITGLIQANIPNRVVFKVATSRQSVIVLGHGGAEKLTGKGDMLFLSEKSAGVPKRMQGVFTPTEDINKMVQYIKDNNVTNPSDGKRDSDKPGRKSVWQKLFGAA